jgi:hypothetical protein
MLEYTPDKQEELRTNDPESDTGVLDRTDGQWKIKNNNNEYGYGFWLRFLGHQDNLQFISTLLSSRKQSHVDHPLLGERTLTLFYT